MLKIGNKNNRSSFNPWGSKVEGCYFLVTHADFRRFLVTKLVVLITEVIDLQVLKIISQIWKSGANIYLDTDDRVAIKNQKMIPKEVMQAAEQNFQDIDKWFKSWKNASGEKVTLMKMVHQICGWQHNEKINEWLCKEADSLMMFDKWMIVLAKNGWKDIYDDYRQFENKESDVMARELYVRAVTYAKKGA